MSAARRVAVATSNRGKVVEIRALLGDLAFELVPAADLGGVAYPEEGDAYAPNALAKARAAVEQLGVAALADDSGLEVDALGGAPGPHSARYGGPGLDDPGRIRVLLEALDRVPLAERGARFVCFAALATRDGEDVVERGVCEGRILLAPRGARGFGYDPVFEPLGHERSMAELPAAEKNRISHRAKAFRGLVPALQRLAG